MVSMQDVTSALGLPVPATRRAWTVSASWMIIGSAHRSARNDTSSDRRPLIRGRAHVTTKPGRKKLVAADASRGLDVAFATKALRDLCEREAKASKALGALAAQRLKQRLADFFAAETVAELPRVTLPHSVSIEVEVALADDVVLVFRANHNDTPATRDGFVDWHRVTRIQILRIGSPHG